MPMPSSQLTVHIFATLLLGWFCTWALPVSASTGAYFLFCMCPHLRSHSVSVSLIANAPDDGAPSNLPPSSYNGTFTVNATSVINAPVEKVWDILLDFPNYGAWNPFVYVPLLLLVEHRTGVLSSLADLSRSQVITDENQKPLADQTPVEGAYLLMQVHIPATLNPAALNTTAFEIVSHLEPDTHRAAWRNLLPEWFIHAERWQAVSTVGGGQTLYESREVFAGSAASTLEFFLGKALQDSFVAQAQALKTYAELQN
ncbi:hypothetical protein C8Q78DRAFT_733942 [Trametes maxima]|nr:hypothetical protein C8Q78DRAFT_733942 [Trametes maxima]